MRLKLWVLSLLVLVLICSSLLPRAVLAEEGTTDGSSQPNGTAYRELTEEQTEKIKSTREKFEFQTEVSRLMNLIINSLYKTREIFLRELISNASDAIDKIRFLALTDPHALDWNPALNISISSDKENRVLIISDGGIGMTRKQLVTNLGTIARSGTSEFLDALEQKKADMSLIGQFGVGFYSVFLVADRVVVTSKHNDDKQHIWESTAVNDFTIVEDPRGNTLGRGTQIKLYLKEDALEFLEEKRLHDLIIKYSEFINFPIHLWKSKVEHVEQKEEEAKEEAKEETKEEVKKDEEKKAEDKTPEEMLEELDPDAPKIEVVQDEKKEEKQPKTVPVTVHYWDLVNHQKPIWTRDPKNITDEEYEQFYYTLTKDYSASAPLSWIHFKAEGEVDFRSIIYIPSKAPRDLYKNQDDYTRNVKLFVKRVFITDEFIDFIPKHFAFVKAMIDAEDAPLNVSRETLQQHRILRLIQKHIIKKILEMISNITKDDKKCITFMKEFGTSLKVGAIEDKKNSQKIVKLLRFHSSYTKSNLTSLDEYIERMKKNQSDIYFVTSTSVEASEKSPFLERLLARGYEVLYLTEPIDEIFVQHVPTYSGKMFQNIAKGDLKFGDEDEQAKEEQEQLKTKFGKVIEAIQKTLENDVEKVEISKRLTASPCAVVANSWGWTGNMQKIMAAQAFKTDNDMMANFFSKQKKIFEINPNHPLILGLLERADNDRWDEQTKELVQVLYETTLLRSGYELKDSVGYTSRVEKVLRANLGIDLEAQPEVKENVAPEPDDKEKQERQKLLQQDKDLFEEQDEQQDEANVAEDQEEKSKPKDDGVDKVDKKQKQDKEQNQDVDGKDGVNKDKKSEKKVKKDGDGDDSDDSSSDDDDNNDKKKSKGDKEKPVEKERKDEKDKTDEIKQDEL